MSKKNESDKGPMKFVVGLIVGLVMTSSYVKWGWKKPALLEMPEQVTASVLAATASEDLYDLEKPLDVRLRALEVIAQQRPDEILKVDAEELNHALLEAFYRRRARREALRLSMQWTAFDVALEKPALRQMFEQKYRVQDTELLKRAMLYNALRDEPFLKTWLENQYPTLDASTLLSTLHEVRRAPEFVAGATNTPR